MTALSDLLRTWRLKLSHSKAVTAAFHLNNQEAKRKLAIGYNSLWPDCPLSTCLGVKLIRFLTFHHQIERLRRKLKSSVALLKRLVGSGLGVDAKTLRLTALFLIYYTSEYCAPVCWRSAHTRLLTVLSFSLSYGGISSTAD